MNKIISILVITILAAAVAVPVSAASSVINGGFESGTGSNADDWVEGTDNTRSADKSYSGTYSLRSAYTGSVYVATTQTIYFSSGTWYISFWAYRENGTGSAWLEYGNIYNYCQFYTDTGITDTWQQITGTCNIAGSYSGHIWINSDDLTESVYFDDVCASKTVGDCWLSDTPTPTQTLTPTPTQTLTPSNTPTNTLTPTITDTPTITNTPIYTFTPSNTPTITNTPAPGTVIWADGPVTLSEALTGAIEDLLESDPPEDAEGWVYVLTHVSGVDTSWNISIVNLVGVDPPYTDFNLEDDSGWSWFLECNGTEPDWICNYYELEAVGGDTGLRFPWPSGYSSKYGILGVHDGAQMIPGSQAVDFVSGNISGSNAAPNKVIAAADGVITSVCDDGISMAIRVDGGPVPLAYFHLQVGQSFNEGQTITKGQTIGVLRSGSFGPDDCGWAEQSAGVYHLHFVFLPTSPGYLEIGGCVLNLSTENFICDGVTYSVNSWIPNGGGSSVDPDPTDPIEAGGGAHIWDGIVAMIVELSDDLAGDILPEQAPIVSYMLEKGSLIIQVLLSFFSLIYVFGFSGSFFMVVLSALIAGELVILLTKITFWLGRLIIPLL